MSELKGLSLFANVGIAEAYLKDIGIDILVANEIDNERAKFYQDIYPDCHMICGDITKKDIFEKVINESLEKEIDFVMATPPCQGMSEAGLRLEFDKRNQLVYYAVEAIKRIKPKFAFMENVPKQLTTKIKCDGEVMLIPEYIKKELEEFYDFNKETLIMAKDHGVPQLRQRNIFLLVRKDQKLNWEFPKNEPEITLQDAIGNLPPLDPFLREGKDLTLEKFPDYERKCQEALKISKWNYPPKHSWKQVEWMMHTPTGKSAIYNEKYYPQKPDGTRIKAHHNNYRRLKWDMPCRTVTQNNGCISSLACVHPGRKIVLQDGTIIYSDARVLTIYELMIIMSLPLDWPIPEWASESLIRKVFGEGIPSLLVKKIMDVLINKLKEKK